MLVDPKLISWQGNVGILEASDLGNDWLIIPELVVISGRTGVTKRFYFLKSTKDEEGDLLYSEFKTTTGEFYLRVLND